MFLLPQAQLALMEVQWPEGLMEADSSVHMRTTSNKGRRSKRKCKDRAQGLQQLCTTLSGANNSMRDTRSVRHALKGVAACSGVACMGPCSVYAECSRASRC
jgi:hypothetical protein